MIKQTKNILSENPNNETWKYLRFFLHEPSTQQRIRLLHKIPENKYSSDIKKQAKQIQYCIRQAEQYFKASNDVGLATRPVLLYYGAVSLTQALVLLKKDGSNSLDFLRKSKKHRHHGLELAGPDNCFQDSKLETFFSNIACKCFTKVEDKPIPWGQFALFYESLIPPVFMYNIDIKEMGKASYLIRENPHPCADILPLKQLLGKRLDLLTIIKTLPDLYFLLQEFSILPDIARGNLKEQVTIHYKPIEEGQIYPMLEKQVFYTDFFIDSLSDENKQRFLASYKTQIPDLKVINEFPQNIHLRLVREHLPAQNDFYFFPDIVDDINGNKFYIVDPQNYIIEPAACFIILFCLGMLARYYPDIWIKAIDENTHIAELTTSILNVAARKFPNLILDQMSMTKHFIHS